MNIKSFPTNFRAGCAGLTAALMLLSSTSAYAQSNQSNGSTKVLPIQQGGAAGGLGRAGGNITAAIAQSGGAGSTQAAATIAAIQTAAGGGAAAVGALTTALTNAGVAPGLAANLAVVTTLTIPTVTSILANTQSSLPTPNSGSGLTASLSTGTLVASSEPMFLAQTAVTPVQNTTAAVREAYDALTQAFIAGGVDPTNAQRNAANMLIALASVKYAAPLGGGVNIRQINRIATLIEPAIAALPGLRRAVTDNPNLSLTTFRQVQATIGVLEPMALLVRVVNENV
ncbi:MAG: hypothetical protein WBB28_22095 [Crinalium sp.]